MEFVETHYSVDEIPISAQTYPTICEEGSDADIYNKHGLGKIDIPTLIPYGTKDIGIVKIDKTMENWLGRVNKFKNSHTEIEVIEGAEHGFRGFENELADKIELFLRKHI